MTLFETDSQYREKATQWRIFSLPLFHQLAGGHIFRWFAVNIPMDLGTGGPFTSDLDIVARLRHNPPSKEWFYRAWEVKVTLLNKDGTARSLKAGKTKKTLSQLKAYRRFGAPEVSLLDIYLCESGFLGNNPFPPPVLHDNIRGKLGELGREKFGYQLLPFEHGKDAGGDIGLFAIRTSDIPYRNTFDILPAAKTETQEPFVRLMEHLDDFFERSLDRPSKHFHQVVFCRECRRLQLLHMKDVYLCPTCSADLIIQS